MSPTTPADDNPVHGRVLILAPRGRDAALTAEILGRAGLPATPCRAAGEFCACLAEGAGALVLTAEALDRATAQRLGGLLAAQRPWSNLPVLLLLGGRRGPGACEGVGLLSRLLGPPRPPVLLQRPLPVSTLVSVVGSALAARRGQYQVRDLLGELAALNASLEARVEERTALALQRTGQLRALSTELLRAEEREQRRLAQVLHDDLQQILLVARMQVETLGRLEDPAPRQAQVGETRALLNHALEVTRTLTVELSPPVLAARGLAAAVGWLATLTQRAHVGINIQVHAHAADDPGFGELAVFLFRAVRELLLNALKHAGEAITTIEITQERGGRRGEQLCLRVRDDGAGFEPASLAERPYDTGGFGLTSIRERAAALGGQLGVESAPGCGTTMTLWVPLETPTSHPRQRGSRTVGATKRPNPSRSSPGAKATGFRQGRPPDPGEVPSPPGAELVAPPPALPGRARRPRV